MVKKILTLSLILTVMLSIFVPCTSMAIPTHMIDTSKTGAIRLYKYEIEAGEYEIYDTSGSKVYNNGSVLTANELDTIDIAGAKKLPNVTFTAKRVVGMEAGANNTVNLFYYNSSGTKTTSNIYAKNTPNLPSVSSVQSYKRIKADGTASSLAVNNTDTSTDTYKATTNSDGYIEWTSLPLGMYLIEEIDGPSHITTKIDPFIVSIPFTIKTGDLWSYNAYIYPKNETTYANLTLIKHDYSSTNAKLQGASFTLTSSWHDGNDPEITKSGTTNSNGAITFSRLPVNRLYTLTETSPPPQYVLSNETNDRQKYIYIDADKNIHLNSSSGTKLNPVDGVPTIYWENSKPTIRKSIDLLNGKGWNTSNPVEGAYARQVNSASFGQSNGTDMSLTYDIDITTPPGIAFNKLTSFKVTDTLTNISAKTDNSPNVRVLKVINITNNTEVEQNSRTYEASVSDRTISGGVGTCTLTINFCTNDNTLINKNNTYRIIVQTNAHQSNYTTNNQAEITYKGYNNTVATVTSNTTEAYTSGYLFRKTNMSGAGLNGFKYKLYKTLTDAQNNTNPVSARDVLTGTWTDTFTSKPRQTGSTNEDGYVEIAFLDYDTTNHTLGGSCTYYLVETKAASGYNLLKEPVQIQVTRSSRTSNQMTIKNADIPQMPLTGGIRYIIIPAIGFIIFIGAVITIICIKRRKNSKIQ